MLPFFIDNPTVVSWDQRIGKYVIYTRALAYGSENQRRIGADRNRRPAEAVALSRGESSPDRS